MVTCVASGCTNRSGKSAVTFHSFPKDSARKSLWIKALRRIDWKPTKHSRICSVHFREADIDRTSLSNVRIRCGAVPCIFTSFPPYMQNVVKQRCILQKPSQEIIIPVKHDGMNELSSSQEYTIIEYICTGECIGELDYDRKKSHCQQKMMNVTTEVKWNPRGVKVMEQKWQIWKWTNW
ncbi:THAP domain-containing protein 2-like isoform X10 [Schistocerca americana]|uniref:THAP domain-containing protein 2-like isoform X10 n=1 Tax=Schistocerca americana TaxID=7009 RepID=UPI001F4FE57F|nr:THAP domain-containing protein 2-like isoform X10 [Schistocerca americana]XP_049958973.1 THAP domain-containing protein 2-like isoform X8 [Schistocerca serialis cubense]